MKQVLVIDDDSGYLTLFTRLASRCDTETTVALSCADGLDKLQDRAFDLVLLDIVMPNVNGWECLQEIHKARPDQKVVVISGIVTSNMAQGILKITNVHFFPKPITAEDIEQLLHECR